MDISFKAAKPDPRILILQIAMVSIVSFTVRRWTSTLLLFLSVDLLVWYFLTLKRSLQYLLQYLLIFGAEFFLQYIHIPILSSMFPVFLVMVLKIMPVYLSLVILLQRTPMNELMMALRKWHIPMLVIIPLAVIYRYLPTIYQEAGYVHESLMMRGVYASGPKALCHPIRTVENHLIPLLFRSEKITEELSAASLCKGLSVERERTCCEDVRLCTADYVYLAAVIAVGCLMLYASSFLFTW